MSVVANRAVVLEDEDEARPLTSKGPGSHGNAGPSGGAAAPKAYLPSSSSAPAVEPKSGADVAYPTLLSVWRPVYDLASPVLLTYVLTFGIPIVTLIFVGHLGKDELAVRARVCVGVGGGKNTAVGWLSCKARPALAVGAALHTCTCNPGLLVGGRVGGRVSGRVWLWEGELGRAAQGAGGRSIGALTPPPSTRTHRGLMLACT